MNFLKRLIFKLRKPIIVGVSGNNKEIGMEALNKTLKGAVFPFKFPSQKLDLDFLVESSKLPILAVTALGEIPAEEDFFAAEKEEVKEILKVIKEKGEILILNYDDETVRELKEQLNLKSFSYGLGEGADFRATDIKISEKGTNFKLNYDGKVVPIWLKNLFGKKNIYAVLLTLTIATKIGLNLVNISQKLNLFKGVKGEGKLIKGIKGTKVLDESANASPFSVDENLRILKRIKAPRKIAVLGDILGIGKYAIEAHEAIGEKVSGIDLLFTIGLRAKFIGKEANIKGMPKEKIFHFNRVGEAGRKLQDKMKEGDLILVDGSSEMKMNKIVEEIKKV